MTYSLTKNFCKQPDIYLTYRCDPYKILTLWVRVDMGVMASAWVSWCPHSTLCQFPWSSIHIKYMKTHPPETSSKGYLFNLQMWHLQNTTSLGQSGHGSNGSESETSHSPKLLDWSLITECSLVSYPRHPFFGGWGSWNHYIQALTNRMPLYIYIYFSDITKYKNRIIPW